MIEGYSRIEAALLERGCNLFSDHREVAVNPITAMTAAQALHLLHMHKNIACGIGGQPGKSWRTAPRRLVEVRTN